MKGLLVFVYRNGSDTSNKGISAEHNEIVLVGPGMPEIFDATPRTPAVKIVERPRIGKNGSTYYHAEPVEGKALGHVGWMFGGTFIYSSDDRFPFDHPIPLHDRQESSELYDMMSR